jgi:hypothetical protein
MDIQSTLSLLIQVLVMGFVSLVVVEFVNGLFWLPYSYSAMPLATSKTNAFVAASNQEIASTTPAPIPPVTAAQAQPTPSTKEEPQFAQLPDPWEFTDITPNSIQHQPLVLGFSSLTLLPPAASVVQPKARTTTKSTKTSTAKRTTKPTNKAATQKNSKRSKSAAA